MKLTRKDLEQFANQQAERLRTDPVNHKVYTDVVRFSMDLKLKTGKHKVKPAMVYKSYSVWSEDPIEKDKFFQEFDEIFFTQDGYYLLNLRPLELLNKSCGT